MQKNILLTNGHIVDPVNNREGVMDVLIGQGIILNVQPSIRPPRKTVRIDLRDKIIVPGIIDIHVHLHYKYNVAICMLAKAGITTALDFAGLSDYVSTNFHRYSPLLNIGTLNPLWPGLTLSSSRCGRSEIIRVINQSLEHGALGVKIIGGHYPLSTATTRNIIQYANSLNAYIAWHAGTLATPLPFPAFLQAIQIAEDSPLHLAHINSYCRGASHNAMEEAWQAIRLLGQHPNIKSDSYLSAINGTSGKCVHGKPASKVTCRELKHSHYSPDRQGLQKAIYDGIAPVCKTINNSNQLVGGDEGVSYWKKRNTAVWVSFRVNPSINAIALAMHKNNDGRHTVTTLSTDGGFFPRNSIVHLGTPLTRYADFRLSDFVMKTSVNPAALLGLHTKGHIGIDADADLTVLDMHHYEPYMTIVGGNIVMREGQIVGAGGRFIITDQAIPRFKRKGWDVTVADMSHSLLYDSV